MITTEDFPLDGLWPSQRTEQTMESLALDIRVLPYGLTFRLEENVWHRLQRRLLEFTEPLSPRIISDYKE